MTTLRDLSKVPTTGTALNWPSATACVNVQASHSYGLCGERGVGYFVNCSGIVIDADGYDALNISFSTMHFYSWTGASTTVYIEESDSPTGPFDLIYSYYFNAWAISWAGAPSSIVVNIPLTKRYLHIYGVTANTDTNGQGAEWTFTFLNEYWPPHKITVNVHTPQGYPVYNAVIKALNLQDNSIIIGDSTDKNGVGYIWLETLDYPNGLKIWGEKTINKTLADQTAEAISKILDIDVDER